MISIDNVAYGEDKLPDVYVNEIRYKQNANQIKVRTHFSVFTQTYVYRQRVKTVAVPTTCG